MREEIKKRLNLGNVCYPSVQNVLSYPLLHKNIKIKIYRSINIIQPVVSNKCTTCSFIFGSEQRLRVRYLGLSGWISGDWISLHNEQLHDLCFSSDIIRVINLGGCPGWCTWHAWGRREMYNVFWRGNLKVRGHLEAPNKAVPWLRRLVAGIPLRRPGFDPGSVHVGFVVDKIALRQVFQPVLRFVLLISFKRCSVTRKKKN
jgi:hypothetical protein